MWYGIGPVQQYSPERPHKVTIWDTHYVVWQNNGTFYALHDACSHKGASLSKGKLKNKFGESTHPGESNICIACPYHGYEFDHDGHLCYAPGIRTPPKTQTTHPSIIQHFDVCNVNGWLYLNTQPKKGTEKGPGPAPEQFLPPELIDTEAQVVVTMEYTCHARLVTENLLDIMHLTEVHQFGNDAHPHPTSHTLPKKSGSMYASKYTYLAGEITRRLFGAKVLSIENGFMLPHTSITRIRFDGYENTVITQTLPIHDRRCIFTAKVYRNFLISDPFLRMVVNAVLYYLTVFITQQDKAVVESIDPRHMDGKYNMKYDALQARYVQEYKTYIQDKISPYKNER